MILFDFSQMALSNYFKNAKLIEEEDPNGTLFKHLVLNSIRSYIVRYRYAYGNEVVIAVDASNSWRKDFFPEYKAHRKEAKQKDNVDWSWVFGVINELVHELDEIFPYKVIKVNRAEGDDIIGVLTRHYASQSNPILICSSDGDFKQLQKYPGVKQFAPAQNKEVKEDNPNRLLLEKFLRGDPKDGIPNFMSRDRTFVDGERQKPIKTKDIEQWLGDDSGSFLLNMSVEANEYFSRNQLMIDLEKIPEWLENNILSEYQREHAGSKNAVLSYFVENKMKELSKCLDEF